MTQPTARTTVAVVPAARDPRRPRARAVVALAVGALLASGATVGAATLSTADAAGHAASGSTAGWFYLD